MAQTQDGVHFGSLLSVFECVLRGCAFHFVGQLLE